MKNLLGCLISLSLCCYISPATASSNNDIFIKNLLNPTYRLTGTDGGQFTMDGPGVLHFFETYFYSDSGCTTLMNNGVASFVDSGPGMLLLDGHTYTLNSSSIYQLASNRGLTVSNVNCMQVYMDGDNNSSNGVSCMNYTEDCAVGSTCKSNTVNTATWGSEPSECVQRYAYISNNSSLKNIVKCKVEKSGILDNCTTTGTTLQTSSLGNAFNNGYGYFANNVNASSTFSVTSCNMNPNNSGALSNSCTNNSSSLSAAYQIKGMAISGTYAYIIDGNTSTGDGHLNVCTISSSNGSLSSCSIAVNSGFNDPRGIVINNGYAYITNNGNNTVTKCTVSGTTVNNCSSSNPGSLANSPSGITTYNGYLFFVNSVSSPSGQVVSCYINSDGDLEACTQTGPTSTSNYQGITIYQNRVYLTNGLGNFLEKCGVSSGAVSNCSTTGDFDFTGYRPNGISIY